MYGSLVNIYIWELLQLGDGVHVPCGNYYIDVDQEHIIY
jgi:hypothetical protein